MSKPDTSEKFIRYVLKNSTTLKKTDINLKRDLYADICEVLSETIGKSGRLSVSKLGSFEKYTQKIGDFKKKSVKFDPDSGFEKSAIKTYNAKSQKAKINFKKIGVIAAIVCVVGLIAFFGVTKVIKHLELKAHTTTLVTVNDVTVYNEQDGVTLDDLVPDVEKVEQVTLIRNEQNGVGTSISGIEQGASSAGNNNISSQSSSVAQAVVGTNYSNETITDNMNNDLEAGQFSKEAIVINGINYYRVTYVIKNRDTLWHLSGNFLKNPFLWPRIHENNSYISNPHLIEPDDKLIILIER